MPPKCNRKCNQKGKRKKTDAKLNPYGDPNAVLGALPCDLEEKQESLLVVTFKSTKLGLTIEANTVSKAGKAGTQAQSLGVQAGWVINRINTEPVPADKAVIPKQYKRPQQTVHRLLLNSGFLNRAAILA